MRRLDLLLRCVLLAALCLLPACAVTTAQPNPAAPSPAAAARPAPITLTLWHSWSGARLEALNSLARAYEQANPDVRITLVGQPSAEMIRSYSTTVSDGSAPQLLLVLGRYVGDLAERQFIAPLDGALATAAQDALLPQALDSARSGGQLYGVPISFDTLALFYDKRRVAAPPATMDQVLALNTAQRAEPRETRPLSLAYHLAPETTLPYLAAFGGAVLDDQQQPSFAGAGRDATLRWLEWLRGLQADENAIASPDFSAVDAAIQQSRVLSAIDWTHRRANYDQLWGGDAVGVAALPPLDPATPPQPLLLPQVIAINTVIAPEQKAAAQAFVSYLIEPAAQETLWTRGQLLPVHTAAALPPAAETFRGLAQGSQPLRSELSAPRVWRPLNDMIRSVLLNTASPAEALDAANAAIGGQ